MPDDNPGWPVATRQLTCCLKNLSTDNPASRNHLKVSSAMVVLDNGLRVSLSVQLLPGSSRMRPYTHTRPRVYSHSRIAADHLRNVPACCESRHAGILAIGTHINSAA